MSLTPARLRQIGDAISYRRKEEIIERYSLTGRLAQVTAATFGGKKAVESVAKMFDLREAKTSPPAQGAARVLDFDPENPEVKNYASAEQVATLNRLLGGGPR